MSTLTLSVPMETAQPLGPWGLAAIAIGGAGVAYLVWRSRNPPAPEKPALETTVVTRDTVQPPPVPPAPTEEIVGLPGQEFGEYTPPPKQTTSTYEQTLAAEIAERRRLEEVAEEAGIMYSELEAAIRKDTVMTKIEDEIAAGVDTEWAYAMNGVVSPSVNDRLMAAIRAGNPDMEF